MNLSRPIFLAIAVALLTACGSPQERASQHIAAAEQLLEQGDVVKAKLEAQNAVQIQPRNSAARMLLARIAEQNGMMRDAAGHLLIVIDEDPDNLEARLKLGEFYFLGRAVEPAREQADAALRIAPEDARSHLLNAQVMFLQGDKAAAMTEVDRALELEPGVAKAVMFKAGLLGDRGEIQAAAAVIDHGIRTGTPEDANTLRRFRLQLLWDSAPKALIEEDLTALADDFTDSNDYKFALAQFYARENRVEEAEQVLRRTIESDPDYVRPRLQLISLLAAKRGEEAAVAAVKGFIEGEPENLQLRRALGGVYERFERMEDAYRVYADLAELSPVSAEGISARNRMAAIDVARERLESARKLTDAVLVDAPDNPDALLLRAAFHFGDRAYDEAIADLRLVLRKNERSASALRLLAQSYALNGDGILAQDAYRRLLALQPGDELAAAELAGLLAASGDAGAAEEVLRDRLEVDPNDADAMSDLVQTLLVQRDIAAAEREARRLVEFDQDNPFAQFQLGQALQAQGSTDAALDAYKRALAQNPDAIQALQALVRMLTDNGRASEALGYLQGHVAENPDQSAARVLLGSLYALLGEPEAARNEYETVIAADPETPEAYLGLAGLETPNSDAQLAVFRRGHEANPNHLRMTLMLTKTLEQNQRYEEAIIIYEEQVRLNPQNVPLVNNLAALLLDHRDDEASHRRALALVEKFESSNEPILLDTLGWAYYRNGNYALAVRHLERAVSVAGQEPVLRYHLGMAYAKNNNVAGAKQELSKALDLARGDFPRSEEALAKLAEIESS